MIRMLDRIVLAVAKSRLFGLALLIALTWGIVVLVYIMLFSPLMLRPVSAIWITWLIVVGSSLLIEVAKFVVRGEKPESSVEN